MADNKIGTLIDPKKKAEILQRIKDRKAPFCAEKPEPEVLREQKLGSEVPHLLTFTRGFSPEAALYKAIVEDNIDKIKELVQSGVANVNAVDDEGHTLLMTAIVNKKAWAAQFLVEHGADLNVKNNYGVTPLICAAVYRTVDIARLLIQRGAEINAQDNDGKTALAHAIIITDFKLIEGQKEMVEYLCTVPGIGDLSDNGHRFACDGATPEIMEILKKYKLDFPF